MNNPDQDVVDYIQVEFHCTRAQAVEAMVYANVHLITITAAYWQLYGSPTQLAEVRRTGVMCC